MTALTQNRDTKVQPKSPKSRTVPVAAGVKIYQGACVVIDSAGNAAPASEALGLTPLGRARFQYPESVGIGDFTVEVEDGIFNYVSAGGADTITADHRGQFCYLIDDQTVGITDGHGTRSPAGTVYDVDGQGVWVALSFPSAGLSALIAGGGGGGAPTGPAGGDLAGSSYPNPLVATVGGATAAAIAGHLTDTANPHGVSAAQVGALPLGGGTMSGTIAMGGGNISGAGAVTAIDFNGVALTSGGVATNFLNANGAYSSAIAGAGTVEADGIVLFSGTAGNTVKQVTGYVYNSGAGRLEVPSLHTTSETVDGTVASRALKAVGTLMVARSDVVEPTRFVSEYGPQGPFAAWGVTHAAVGPSAVGQVARIGSTTAGYTGSALYEFDYPTMLPTTSHTPTGTAVTLVKNRVNLIDTSSATGAVVARLPANTALVEGDWCLTRVTDTTHRTTVAAGLGSTADASAAELRFHAASSKRTLGIAYNKTATQWSVVTTTAPRRLWSFTNGDLTAGVLILNHAFSEKYVTVSIYDNSDKLIVPDEVTLTDADNTEIDLSNVAPLTGIWNAVVTA